MLNYLKSAFNKAGLWFFLCALVAASPLILLSLPATLIMIGQYCSGDDSVTLGSILGLISITLAPLLTSYVLGGLIGRSILLNHSTGVTESRLRGIIIALGALACFAGVNYLDVLMTDYSGAIETSSERGNSIVSGISLLALPVVAIVGGIGGSLLKAFSRKK
jgi:hypothetical protein